MDPATNLLSSIVYTENFDPSWADPTGNIVCVGGSYDLKLSLLDGFDPNGLSIHKICAKPQYGGGARYQHAGAFCNFEDPDQEQLLYNGLRGDVVFDDSEFAETSIELQNP